MGRRSLRQLAVFLAAALGGSIWFFSAEPRPEASAITASTADTVAEGKTEPHELPEISEPETVLPNATLTRDGQTSAVPLIAGRFAVIGDKYGLQNVADDFPLAMKLAESGDPIAVRTLLSALNTCSLQSADATRTRAEYDEKRAQIEAPDSLWAKDPAGRERQLAQLEQLYQWCKGLKDQHFDQATKLVEIGVERGVPEALSSYEALTRPTDTWREGYPERLQAHYQRTREIYEAEIGRGNRAALLYAALMDFKGQPGVNRDPVSAMAHLLALQTASGGIPENTAASTRLQALNQELSAQQVAEAQRRALEILQRCCG